MHVVQTLKSINISTQDFELFCKIKEIIHKNFTQNLGKKSKILSFFDENEIPQRRYFLKFISLLNKKRNGEQLLNLNTAHYKTFKLQLQSTNCLKPIVNCKLDFLQKNIIFDFSVFDNTLQIYLKNYFKNHECTIIKNKFILTYKNEKTLNLLDDFCEQNEHLHYCISFSLSELAYLQFKKEIHNVLKQDNRFLNVCMLLEEHFKTLGLSVGASFTQVRKQYLRLSKEYHPDFHAEKSEEVKNMLKAKFQQISAAYESLKPLYENVS